MNESWLFCCCFQAVLLLFSNFFALLFSNFDAFQKFFRIFSDFFQKFLKNFWKICESRDFLLPAMQKWMKTSCFAAIVKLFALFFSNFDEFQKFFRFFSEFFQKFLKKIWKFSEKFLKYFWKKYESRDFLLSSIQKWRKLAVLLLFSKFSASFSLLLAVPRYQKWRKTSCFAAIFKLFALLFSNFDEFQNFFRIFSEISEKKLKIFWKFSEFFLKNLWIQRFCAASDAKMNEN